MEVSTNITWKLFTLSAILPKPEPDELGPNYFCIMNMQHVSFDMQQDTFKFPILNSKVKIFDPHKT